MTKTFRAYADGATSTYADNPRAAGEAFFEANPNKRKCSVIEGELDGPSFVVRYGRKSEGDWPSSYKDVTKRSLILLPGAEANADA